MLLSETKIDGSFPDSQFHLWLNIGRLDMTEIYLEEAYALCQRKTFVQRWRWNSISRNKPPLEKMIDSQCI